MGWLKEANDIMEAKSVTFYLHFSQTKYRNSLEDKKQGWSQKDLSLNSDPNCGCHFLDIVLGKLLQLSEPQFPHLHDGDLSVLG